MKTLQYLEYFLGEPKIDTNKYIHNPPEIVWTGDFWSKNHTYKTK